MKKIIHIILPALILGIFPVASTAQTTGSISGTIVDSKDISPLSGVIISLEGTNIKARTDELGKFVISNVDTGTYAIRLLYMGCEYKMLDRVNVIAGQEYKININLGTQTFNSCTIRSIPNGALSVEGSGRTFEIDWFYETCRR
jgi:hypothetical protein